MLTIIKTSVQHSATKNKSKNNKGFFKASLYLVLGKNGFEDESNELWIHEFNDTGELRRRFRLASKDVNLVPIFDIDFVNQRIFVVTEEAEIRAYQF